jgi:hypothetical protein
MVVCERARRGGSGSISLDPAAVGSAFRPRGAIQPVPGLFVGPTGNSVVPGNSVAPGDSRARVRAHVAHGRFGATHRRGVGSGTQTDQDAQGQNRSHRVCSPAIAQPQRLGPSQNIADETAAAGDYRRHLMAHGSPRSSLPATAYRTEYSADIPSAPGCDSAPEPTLPGPQCG